MNNSPKVTDWITAIATMLALVGVGVAYCQFRSDHQRSRNQTTLQLLTQLESSRPVNGSICRRLAIRIDDPSFSALLNRETVSIDPEVSKQARACFSDKTEKQLRLLISSEGETVQSLTPRGAAELASRINRILDADEDIAIALQNDLAVRDLVGDVLQCAIAVDNLVVERITKKRGYNYYQAISSMSAAEKKKEHRTDFNRCVSETGMIPLPPAPELK